PALEFLTARAAAVGVRRKCLDFALVGLSSKPVGPSIVARIWLKGALGDPYILKPMDEYAWSAEFTCSSPSGKLASMFVLRLASTDRSGSGLGAA
ncbi:hypothetical protein P0D88_49335, partial [Paraburkholderia sp. RL18-103-BIB-C]|uniref:hypothetical protein n=1 Tax=unclassified Paraburkholderia TaxID=2615204 RepID=UPI0038B8274E